MTRWLAHVLGLDDPSGGWYLFWSGICADLAYLGGLGIAFRHLNCHTPGCWRLAVHRHPGTGVRACRRHHPHVSPE